MARNLNTEKSLENLSPVGFPSSVRGHAWLSKVFLFKFGAIYAIVQTAMKFMKIYKQRDNLLWLL